MKKVITIGCFILFALLVTTSSSGAQLRSSTVIARCVEDHEVGLAYAYESLFRTCAIWPKVKAVVEFTITGGGSVEDVKVLKTEGFDTSPDGAARARTLADRITEAAYTWRFPEVESLDVTVDIPFLFVPVEAEEKEIAESEKPPEEERDYTGIRAENMVIPKRDVRGVYVFEEFIIECRRERAVPFEVARAKPEGDVLATAARDKRLAGAAGKPIRDYLKEVASILDELSMGPASKLRKKLASREREMREVEAALADEESRLAVADLGLSKDYNWRIKNTNAKKVAKLREKRERLCLEIEKLANEISTAEETRSLALAEKRGALIARGEELLDKAPPAGGDPWLVFALAELYLDSGEGAKAAELSKQVIETGEYETGAEALYGLGHAYLLSDGGEKAPEAFYRLTRDYSESPHVAEAYFRLGEYSEQQREPLKAEKYFLLAAENDAQYLDAALYRAAWGYYECSDPFGVTYYDRAVPAFKRFLGAAQEGPEYWDHAIEMTGLCLAEWEPGTPERPAPLDALIRYEEVFGAAEEKPYSADVLRALGDAYLYRMDRLPEAAATYEYLLGKYHSYGNAPGVIKSVVESHLRREAYDDAHAARIRLVDEYGPASSWYRAQDDLTRCEAIQSWENALYEVGVYYNMQAERKSKIKPEEAPALYESAINRYNQYLASFPTNEKAYHINFYLAESYYAVEDFETAAQHYIKTATHYKDRERYKIDKWDERFTQEQSFYDAVLSYGELYEKSDGLEGSREIHADKLLSTCEEFLARYAETTRPRDAMTVLMKIGDVYSREGDFEKARENYTRIVEDYSERVYEGIRYKWIDSEVDRLYVSATKNVADAYLEEAKLIPAGAERVDEKYNQYRDWFERAKAEAEKRRVDFEYQMESLE